jgi:hypothetical protein
VGLERFYAGKAIKNSALLYFDADPVTHIPLKWFKHYNGGQTIEAGIKETKQVFYLHKIKGSSETAIFYCGFLWSSTSISSVWQHPGWAVKPSQCHKI